jgi:GNAT superfamily N-acetyltransferase
MGGRGFEFLLADGMVFLDAGDTEDGVYVSQIAVAPQRTGLGRRVMLALRRYCDERNRRLVVYKVAAPGFFAALGWLQRHPRFTEFTYEPWQPEPMRPPVAGAGRPREKQGVVISINVASA